MTTPIRPIDLTQRATLGAIVTDQLRAHVIQGGFEPGTALGEVALAQQFGVSRGPIREALQRLVQEGLLRREPRRGISVPRIAAADLSDVCLAREAIEGAALVVAIAGDPRPLVADLQAIVERMAAAVERGDWVSVAELDLAFHRRIVEATRSPRLARLYSTVLAETIAFFNMTARSPGREQLVAEHAELVALVAAGDIEGYRRTLGSHLAESVDRLTRLAEAQAPSPGGDGASAPSGRGSHVGAGRTSEEAVP